MEEKFRELKELMLLGEIDGDELIRRWQDYSGIDDEKALSEIRRRIAAETAKSADLVKVVRPSFWQRYRYAVAAAVAAILVAGGILLLRPKAETDGVPSIPQSTQIAMEQSKETGKQQADLKALAAEAIVKAVRSTPTAQPEYFADAKQVSTEETKEYWLTLDDGSVIHLNNDTYLIYPEKKEAKTREVILDGEAYFSVAKDVTRPFVVHTRQGDVKVYGTEFNVSTRETEGATEVVLVEGSVSVTPAGGQEQKITPGQKATVGKTVTIEDVDVDQYVAWNTGKFAFQDWPLGRIMAVIGKWYGCTVTFADEALTEPRLSGNFDRYDELSSTVESLSMVTVSLINKTEGTIFIHR